MLLRRTGAGIEILGEPESRFADPAVRQRLAMQIAANTLPMRPAEVDGTEFDSEAAARATWNAGMGTTVRSPESDAYHAQDITSKPGEIK